MTPQHFLKKTAAATSILSALPALAHAHPGHDHSALTSIPIHFVYYAPLLGAGALVVYLLYRNHLKTSQHKDDNHSSKREK